MSPIRSLRSRLSKSGDSFSVSDVMMPSTIWRNMSILYIYIIHRDDQTQCVRQTHSRMHTTLAQAHTQTDYFMHARTHECARAHLQTCTLRRALSPPLSIPRSLPLKRLKKTRTRTRSSRVRHLLARLSAASAAAAAADAEQVREELALRWRGRGGGKGKRIKRRST